VTHRVLIVDDEQPARERLRALLGEIRGVEVVGEAANGAEALQLVERCRATLVLLDVRMPGMDGIETAQHLAVMPEPPALVFATAHDEYAVTAFEARAIGYLLKPVRKEKLVAALSHAARLSAPQLRPLSAAGAGSGCRTHIAARHREGIRLIPVEEVLYFYAEQKYTTVRHARGEDLIEDSLRLLEEEFGDLFVRIHRSALVSTRHLDGIERSSAGQYSVHLRGLQQALPVSRRMARELRERLRL
jgi:two-component system, LytTR family, response regulator AlgR